MHRDRRSVLALGLAALFTLMAFTLLASWRAGIPNRYYDAYERITDPARLVPDLLARAPAVLPVIARRMISFSDWGIFWWAVPVILIAGWRGLRRPVALPLAMAAAAPLVIGWGAYAVYPDPVYLANVTWSRMLLQASLPLLLLLAFALRSLLSRPSFPARMRL